MGFLASCSVCTGAGILKYFETGKDHKIFKYWTISQSIKEMFYWRKKHFFLLIIQGGPEQFLAHSNYNSSNVSKRFYLNHSSDKNFET